MSRKFPLSLPTSSAGSGNFPPRPPSSSAGTPSSRQSNSPPIGNGSQQSWSFEEQFKQLYEIDDNPKRKEFLDELFSFMQKRGSPINRLPIMAKQVLDLMELYNLVIARGGLVEVINKKLWQEVIKGLGLPSSITSAAFTLRTQYTKYLYPLECHKKNLSNPTELQAAIEGNKREGRQRSFGAYPDGPFPSHHMAPLSPLSMMQARSIHQQLNGGSPHFTDSRSPPISTSADQMPPMDVNQFAALFKFYNNNDRSGMPPVTLPNLPGMPHGLFSQEKMQQLAAQQQRFMGLNKQEDKENRVRNEDEEEEVLEDEEEEIEPVRTRPSQEFELSAPKRNNVVLPETNGNPDRKRPHTENGNPDVVAAEETSPRKKPKEVVMPIGANIKITNRGDAQNGDSSLVVSMEINGVNYQGVLFAHPHKERTE